MSKVSGIYKVKVKNGYHYRAAIIINGLEIKKTFSTEKAAIQFRENMKKEREKSKIFNNEYMDYITTDNLFDFFMLSKSDKRETSLQTYRSNYEKYIKPTLGNRVIRTIKVVEIDKIKQSMIDNHKSPATIHKIITFIKLLFTFAHRRKYLSYDLTLYYGKPRLDQNKYQFWKKEQIDDFLEKIKDDYYFDIIQIAFNTGLRIGELVALKWSCINHDKNGYSLTFGEQRNQSGKVTGVKGHCTRTIPLTKKAVEIFNKVREKRKDDNELIFLNRKGKPISSVNLSKHWKELQKKHNVAHPIKFHAIRHSFATYLVTQDVPLHLIQQILGHKNSDTTKRYAHIQFNDLKRSMDLVDF